MAKKTKSASKAKKAAPPKIKLTRDQKKHVQQMLRLENRISVCQDYIRMWMQFFRVFGGDIQAAEITEEHEKSFFQNVTGLSRRHFAFCELMSDTFEHGDRILAFLDDMVSLAHLKGSSGPNIAKFEAEWHSLMLEMNVALGRLLRLLPPEVDMNQVLARAAAPAAAPAAQPPSA